MQASAHNFCLVAECDSVSENTEGKKPLLFLLQNKQECVYFHQVFVCVTLSHEHSVAPREKLLILFHKHPAHASPVTVPSTKEEGSPERLSVCSVVSSQWEAKAKDTILIQWAKVPTFHSAKQASNPEVPRPYPCPTLGIWESLKSCK